MKIKLSELKQVIKEEAGVNVNIPQERALLQALDQYVLALDEKLGFDVDGEQLEDVVHDLIATWFRTTYI